MKIVTWNCNGALKNKLEVIRTLNADIYVIQECENPYNTPSTDYRQFAHNSLYLPVAENRKSIGIFAHPSISLTPIQDNINSPKVHPLKYFLPCLINHQFLLVNVWTHLNKSGSFGYVGQIWQYIQNNQAILKTHPTILLGDFNSNTIFDPKRKKSGWNHSNVVSDLAALDIYSTYHTQTKEIPGQETQSTLFMHRKQHKGYHIDYVFASKSIITTMNHFEICSFEQWQTFSDHVPLIFEFDETKLTLHKS